MKTHKPNVRAQRVVCISYSQVHSGLNRLNVAQFLEVSSLLAPLKIIEPGKAGKTSAQLVELFQFVCFYYPKNYYS